MLNVVTEVYFHQYFHVVKRNARSKGDLRLVLILCTAAFSAERGLGAELECCPFKFHLFPQSSDCSFDELICFFCKMIMTISQRKIVNP